jgi:hypothetical protein
LACRFFGLLGHAVDDESQPELSSFPSFSSDAKLHADTVDVLANTLSTVRRRIHSLSTAGGVCSGSTFPTAVSDDQTFPGVEGVLDSMTGTHPVDNPVTQVLQMQDVLSSLRAHRASVADTLVREIVSTLRLPQLPYCTGSTFVSLQLEWCCPLADNGRW